MNIKFIAVSMPLSFCIMFSFGKAVAGFDVINSYEYHGDATGLIRTSPTTQNTRMADSIFIDNGQQYRLVPVATNSSNASGGLLKPMPVLATASIAKPVSTSAPLPAYSSITKPAISSLTDEDVNKLIKSLNNVTFIGKPDKNIFTTITMPGKENQLQRGIDRIVGNRYLVAIYPSVSKKYGTKSVVWGKDIVWVAALDSALDTYNLKAVIDINSGTLYVSEKGSENKSIMAGNATSGIVTPSTVKMNSTASTSPFQSERNVSTLNKTVQNTTQKSSSLLVPKMPAVPVNAINNNISKPEVNLQPVIMSTWVAVTGKSLRTNVQMWSDKQGWRLIWQTNHDYNITAPFTVYGKDTSDVGFMEAIKRVFAYYDDAQYPYKVDAYPEQRLLYVTTKGKDTNA